MTHRHAEDTRNKPGKKKLVVTDINDLSRKSYSITCVVGSVGVFFLQCSGDRHENEGFIGSQILVNREPSKRIRRRTDSRIATPAACYFFNGSAHDK